MSKRLIALVAVLVLVFAIAGCSSGGSSAASPASSEAVSASESASASAEPASASASAEPASTSASTSSGSSLFTSEEWPQNDVTAEAPAPKFSVGLDSLSTSKNMVSGIWKNVPEDEVAAYVEEVKQAGFVYDTLENKFSDMYSYTGRNNEDISESSLVSLNYRSNGELVLSVTNHSIR